VTGPIGRRSFVAGQASGRNSLDHSGRWLAFTKNRPTESQIWLKDLTTDAERHLVTTPPGVTNPIIRFDGAQVAYSQPEGERTGGYLVAAQGGTARQLCAPCALFGWFADNRRILAASREGRLWSIDVIDGTTQDRIVTPGLAVGRPEPSPDGRWISFQAGRHIWLAAVRPGHPPPERDWVLVHEPAANSAERACGWSPDSRLLYLLLERDGFRDLYAQRIDSARGTLLGQPFIVQHLHDPRRRWGSSPIGAGIVRDAFVFSQVEMTGSIWLREPAPTDR
jgi:Tol biopolymer transport system component